MLTRNTLLTFIFSLFISVGFSQQFKGEEAVRIHPNAEKVWINPVDKSIKHIQFLKPVQVPVSQHSEWLKKLHKAGNNVDYILIREMTDQMGQSHFRYNQMVDGYKVEGAQFIVHTIQDLVISANGEFAQTAQVSSTPNIPESSAFSAATKEIPSSQYRWVAEGLDRPKGELVFAGNNFKLAYKFDIYSYEPLGRYDVFIDAQTGAVIQKNDRIHHASANGTAHCKYHGIQTIVTDSTSPTNFVLMDAGRSVTTKDLNNSTSYGSAIHFSDADNIWTSVLNQDDAALDAHWGAEKTYDYYFNNYALDSYDGLGASINSFVHYGTNYVNAFWDGYRMTYGDGNGTSYTALTSIDVVSHEITHAVTEYSAGLIYSYESGALNESFSDIFGVAVDYYANPTTANWYMGDMFHVTGNGFRNMANPNNMSHPDTYQGTHWEFGSFDNGGVHINSGVQNYWYYLLCTGGSGINDNSNSYTVSSIGMTDASAIAYRNLSVYLTPSSQYVDARYYAIQSAVDLYGSCSTQEIQVTNAWYAVGVGSLYSNSVTSNFTVNQTYFCTTPATVSFTNTSISDSARLWIFGDGSTDTADSPTHIYTATGTYTVSLVSYGSTSCGAIIDTLTFSNLITVSATGGPVAATCTPSATTGLANYGIFNFTLNTINNTTPGADDGYKDYSCSHNTTVTEGDIIPISMDNGSVYSNIEVYIDYSNNGAFSASELVFSSTGYGIHSGNITIPATVNTNTSLRVRAIFDSFNPITSTCSTTANVSQIEDYSITILPLSSAPTTDFVGTPLNVLTGSTVTFTNLSSGLPTGYAWSFPGGVPATSTATNPVITYPTVGTYNVQLIATNGFGSDTALKTNYVNVVNQINMCDTILSTTATSGLLYDDGGPTGNYSNGKNCTFLIQPPCADSIHFSFSYINMESCCDRVYVYDGVNTSAPLLGQFTGSSIPSTVTGTSGSLFIRFYTDGSVTYGGFAANWSTVQSGQLPPVASFTVSDPNPPFATPIQFTDGTTNMPNSWVWDFGDGTTSGVQNPSHTYTSAGAKTVELIANNCSYSDTVSQIVTVQGAPVISVNPTSYTHNFTSCVDSVTIPITIYNTGLGDLVLDTNQSFTTSAISSDSSHIVYTVSGQATTHSFSSIPSGIDTLHVTINMDGDFNSSSEYAELIIDGINYGVIPDFSSYIVSYSLDLYGATLQSFLADGTINFVIDNSSAVDIFGSLNNFHEVVLTWGGGTGMLSTQIANDTVAVSDSTTLWVTISALGALNGTYYDSIAIYNNDPTNNPLWVPITINNNGVAHLDVDSACVAFDTAIQFIGDSTLFYLHNPGCDTLEILSITNTSGAYSVSNAAIDIPPFQSDSIWIYFNTNTIGLHLDTLAITTSENDTTICLSGFVVGSPIISAIPDSISVTLTSCNDSIVVPVWVYNTGQGDLDFNINNTGSTGSMVNVLALTYGADFGQEYPNTISAINTYFTNYNLTNTNTTSASVLASELATTDVLLIPELESGNVSTNSALSSTIQNFASNGGWVIMCGNSQAQINAFGLFNVTNMGSSSSGYQTIVDLTSPLVDSLVNPQNFNATYMINTSTPTFNTVTSYNGYIPVGEVNYGSGKVIFIGYDYYAYGPTASRIISNAFKWATYGGAGSSDWISTDPDSGIVVPGDSILVYVTIYGNGKPNGVYNGVLNINSNDPINPVYDIPVNMTISGVAELTLTDSCISFDSLVQFTSDTSGIWLYNTGCDSLDVTSISASSGDVTFDTTTFSIPPYDSMYVTAYFNPDTAQAYSGTINIQTSANDSIICFNGYASGAPIISTNPDSIFVTLTSCDDSLIVPITVYNTGLDTLIVDTINTTVASVGSMGSGKSIAIFRDYVPWSSLGNVTSATNLGYNISIFSSWQMATAYIDTFDMILLPSGQSSTFYSNYNSNKTKFETYLNNGGSIQYNLCLSPVSNILPGGTSYVYGGSGSSTNSITDTTHHMFNGCGITTIYGNSASHGYITNLPVGSTTLTNNNVGLPTTVEYTYGSGNVIVTMLAIEHMWKYNLSCNDMIGNLMEHLSGYTNVNWLYPLTTSTTVPVADSTIVNVVVKSTGLTNGTYNSQVIFSSNDPVNPSWVVPVQLIVNGTAEMNLSQNCVNFDTVLQFTSDTTGLWINNPGCDSLQITNLSSGNGDISFTNTSYNVPAGDSVFVEMILTPDTVQSYTGNILISSNVGDSIVCFNAYIEGAPQIDIDPDSLNVTLTCGDSITIPITVYNTGSGTLDFDIPVSSGGTGGGPAKVLAWTYGSDLSQEYPNTLAAINANFTNYTLSSTGTSVPSVLQAYLSNADILLIPENESGSNSVYTSMATTIFNFVNNGGWVIMCGTPNNTLNSIGLFSATFGSTTSSGTQTIVDPTSPLVNGLVGSFYNSNATFYQDINNINYNPVTTYGSNDVVGYSDIGFGKAVYVGFDFYAYNTNTSKVIANAIEWASSNTAPWLTVSPDTGNVVSGDSMIVYVTISAGSLNPGSYSTTIPVNSNDPVNPSLAYPVHLTVTSQPNLWVSDSCVNIGTVNQFVPVTDSITLANTGCDTLLFTGSSTTDPSVVVTSPLTAPLPDGDSTTLVFDVTPQTIGTFIEYVTVTTNGNDSTFCVTGNVVGSSVAQLSQTYINTDMKICASTQYHTTYLKNTGTVNLVWNYAGGAGLPSMVPSSGTIPPNDSIMVTIGIANTGTAGTFVYNLNFNTNSPQAPVITLPITLTVSNEPCVDFAYQLMSNCNGVVSFNNTSLGAVVSSSWTFGDGNSSTANSPSHTYTSSGNYTVELIVCGPTTCDTTQQIVNVSIASNITGASCYPLASSPTAATGITSVELSTLSNLSGNSTEGSKDWSCTSGTQILVNQPETLKVTTTGTNQYVQAWIDYNNDGQFSGAEMVLSSYGGGLHSNQITPPSSAVLNTPLRLRVKTNITNSALGACTQMTDGQSEDYFVEILPNNLAPVANFNDSLPNECDGLVFFTDKSQFSPTSWSWDFGDGSTSTLQNPIHQYTSDGVYVIQLTASNSNGSHTYSDNIFIDLYEVEFVVSGNLNANQTIFFNPTGDPAVKWNWVFGNGQTSTSSNPSAVYANQGSYIVTLNAESSDGCKSTFIDTILIRDPLSVNNLDNKFVGKVSPNPSNGNFVFQFEGSKPQLHLAIMSSNGQEIFEQDYEVAGKLSVNFDQLKLAAGIYFIRFDDGENYETLKFIVR